MQKQSSVNESARSHNIQSTQFNSKHPTGSPFSMRLLRNENLPVGLSSHKNGDELTLTPVFTLSVYMRIKWFAAMQYQKNGEAAI
jgi:hypothetical protein